MLRYLYLPTYLLMDGSGALIYRNGTTQNGVSFVYLSANGNLSIFYSSQDIALPV